MILVMPEGEGNVHVYREVTDPKRYKSDSHFLYHLKKALQRLGYDVIKKLMWKDGHLVDDHEHYIRERTGKWCIYDLKYAVRLLHKEFMEHGEVVLYKVGLRLES